jgi:hypothetical protein
MAAREGGGGDPRLEGGGVAPAGDHQPGRSPVGGSQQVEALEPLGRVDRAHAGGEASGELVTAPFGDADGVDPDHGHRVATLPGDAGPAPIGVGTRLPVGARDTPVHRLHSFDPRRVGALEARAWECYYRHRWAALLVTSVRLVRAAFAMPWLKTLEGAWWVLRANQRWAPYPDNDGAGAERAMTRFYELVAATYGPGVAPSTLAGLEIRWWRAHRAVQHEGGPLAELVGALGALYAAAYDVPPDAVGPAASLRAEAMVVSDRWVAAGCDPRSQLLLDERALLVRSYAALRAAVRR